MTQINHRKDDMMSAQEVGILTIKPDEQGSEFIDPGETTFVRKALFVDLGVEQAFAPTLRSLAIASVLGDVRDHPVIETQLAGLAGIKGAVGVEECARNGQSQALDAFERRLELGLKVEGVVVIAGNHARRRENVPVRIHEGQNITGLGAFATLIRHALAAFLGNGMTTIQVQLTQVKLALHRMNARLPDFFQAPVGTPFAEVIVHRLPTDFFFVASCGSAAVGNSFHWQPVCRRYRM